MDSQTLELMEPTWFRGNQLGLETDKNGQPNP